MHRTLRLSIPDLGEALRFTAVVGCAIALIAAGRFLPF
jgi:hypothetical protein